MPWCHAALLHLVDWDYEEPSFQLESTIRICTTAGAPVLSLYEQLCRSTGIDDGDPLMYTAYFHLDPSSDPAHLYAFGEPDALVDRLINALVVVLDSPVPVARLIWSADYFLTSDGTAVLDSLRDQTDFLERGARTLDKAALEDLDTVWATLRDRWSSLGPVSRVCHAMRYFYYGWRAPYLHHSAVNLAIALEILFAPRHQGEIAHQVAFNAAAFLDGDASGRKAHYQLLKRFYGIRSQIVHGAIPNENKLIDPTVEAFHLLVAALRRILGEPGLAAQWDDNEQRLDLFDRQLFGIRP